MSVSFLDLSRAAQARALSLTAETAGYLVLAVIDAGGLRQCTALSEMVLLENGEVRLGMARLAEHPAAPERELRALLARLLALCSAAHPILAEVSRAERLGTLAREIEAALIPVNRAAARRTLARACRETERAKSKGKLSELNDDVVAAVPAKVAPAVAPAAPAPVPTERRRKPRAVMAQALPVMAAPVVAEPAHVVVAPVAKEPTFSTVEHTMRIDTLRAPSAPAAEKATARPARSAAVTDRRREPRPTGRRLDDVRAPLQQIGKTPFLGSVVTAMREPPVIEHDTQIDPEAMQVEPIEPIEPIAAPSMAAQPHHETAQVVLADNPSLTHTPPWQPNVQPLVSAQAAQAADLAIAAVTANEALDEVVEAQAEAAELVTGLPESSVEEEVADEEVTESSAEQEASEPIEEMEGFFLLLDESNKPPLTSTTSDESVAGNEPAGFEPEPEDDAQDCFEDAASEEADHDAAEAIYSAPDEDAEPAADPVLEAAADPLPVSDPIEPPASPAPLYPPRRTDLTMLLAGFETGHVESDVVQELKLMAGIDASPSSQTPPPVAFSEISELSPPPADSAASEGRDSTVLNRAKGVGLATLTGLGVVVLLLRGPLVEPVNRSLARGDSVQPEKCLASLRVVDAPLGAEIRVRAPAPNANFAPLAARGSTALFPELPCGASLEVMIRDNTQLDSGWVVIPIAREELTARTVVAPLTVSAHSPR
jgi:hypothetical protein